MAKYIDLNTATDEELVEYLLDYWHIDKLSFVSEFNYDDVRQIGTIENYYCPLNTNPHSELAL